jgi:hypothetical protein
MPGFEPRPADSLEWTRNLLGSEVTRLYTDGAVLTVVHGRKGDVVPAHGYSRGAVTYVVSGRILVDGVELGAGDAGTYTPPAHYYAVKFLEDSTYVVARTSTDEITLPDIGERAASNLDA